MSKRFFATTLLSALFGLLFLIACARPSPTPTPAASELNTIIASTDLAVGQNRFVFAILDNERRAIKEQEVTAAFFLDTKPQPEPGEVVKATFRPWPASVAGVYTTNVTFDISGIWSVRVTVPGEDSRQPAPAFFEVKERTSAPSLGTPPPASRNKTARDVAKLEEITTAHPPDPDLYQMTVAEAIKSGKPTLITFATPAFCLSATCGPQVDVVQKLKDRYRDKANFIHIEIWDNPEEMQGDLSKGRISPIVEEWALITEPFTFLVNRDGLVAAKFEGFTTGEELETALLTLMQ
ncbi:MAG: thioredoxin family protein [Chloroflexi bacterium]|nr:thioredoxin family protein [Chloroflexota bacterium]